MWCDGCPKRRGAVEPERSNSSLTTASATCSPTITPCTALHSIYTSLSWGALLEEETFDGLLLNGPPACLAKLLLLFAVTSAIGRRLGGWRKQWRDYSSTTCVGYDRQLITRHLAFPVSECFQRQQGRHKPLNFPATCWCITLNISAPPKQRQIFLKKLSPSGSNFEYLSLWSNFCLMSCIFVSMYAQSSVYFSFTLWTFRSRFFSWRTMWNYQTN